MKLNLDRFKAMQLTSEECKIIISGEDDKPKKKVVIVPGGGQNNPPMTCYYSVITDELLYCRRADGTIVTSTT